METCTGIADRVVWARTVRPAKVSRSPFHPGILAATESIRACSLSLDNREIESGAPKYFNGKL